MITLYMMYGLPASGKSTLAKEMLKDFGKGNAVRVNKDELRMMLHAGEWSSENEKMVLAVRDSIISSSLDAGKHVIVDDTNLAPKHQERLRQLANSGKKQVKFEVVDFSQVSVDVCIERDRKRPNYVGEKVILDMHRQFLSVHEVAPSHDDNLPNALLVDVDGTLAEMVSRGPFEWGKVFEDRPRSIVADAVALMARGMDAKVLVVSGRDAACRADTARWLNTKCWPDILDESGQLWECLFMRPAGDMRKDSIVKREIYEQHIKGRYNVLAIWDDRPQVIRTWQELGFSDRIFNVGDGREF